MHFANITKDEIDLVFDFYDKAIEFQKTVFHKSWLGFDRILVETEIEEKRSWKIEDDDVVACIYSVTYSDPIIWGANSGESAMYIHRIVTNPDCRGRGYVRSITGWATDFARSNNLRFVRMDTWGDNEKLINYYKDCGFSFRGVVTPEKSAELPKHYSDINLSLFEIDLENE
ncbi:MAG: GNAT family N-acetyltransferase [Acidobacteriota bacterium]